MNELNGSQRPQIPLNEQERQWEENRQANETGWLIEARHGNFLRSLVWTGLHLYLHRGVTPEAIMQKEARELNRQYDLEHYEQAR